MNIVHIMLAGPYTEGMAYQDNILPACQKKLGNKVTFIASCYKFENGKEIKTLPCNYEMEDGVRLIRIPFKKKFGGELIEKKIRSAEGLEELLKKIRPDGIMLHDPQTQSVNAICKYIKMNPNVKFVIDSHADQHNSGKNVLSKYLLHRGYYKHYVKRASKLASHIYGVSYECMQFYVDNYGVKMERMEYLPLGGVIMNDDQYFLERKKVRSEYGIEENDILIVHSGKMTREKRTTELLDAFAKIKGNKVHLVIIGVGDEFVESKIKDTVKSDLRVKYLGWKSGYDLNRYLCGADIYVQPGTQSSTMQSAACARCALILYPYASHKYLMGDAALYAEDTETIRTCIEQLTTNPDFLNKKKEAVYKIASERLNYMKQAQDILCISR